MSSSPLAGPDSARHALHTMWLIRRFEEAVDDLFARGLMHGTMHLSIGQEASATGACLADREVHGPVHEAAGEQVVHRLLEPADRPHGAQRVPCAVRSRDRGGAHLISLRTNVQM